MEDANKMWESGVGKHKTHCKKDSNGLMGKINENKESWWWNAKVKIKINIKDLRSSRSLREKDIKKLTSGKDSNDGGKMFSI